jgi:trimethylamine--corrinoid protein Co-methyltransferase
VESRYVQFHSPQFRLLSDQQLAKLHDASLQIIERTGVTVDCEEAIALLDGAGADVSDPKRVKIPAYLVEQALRTTPKSLTLYTREGAPFIRLAGDRTYFGAIPDQPDYLDPESGERRSFKINDMRAMCRLVDGLPNITWLYTTGWAGYAEGLPGELADRVSVVLALENSTKPVGPCIANVSNLRDMLEVCAIIAGGYDELRQRPFFYGTVEPVTPLVHGRDALEKSLVCAEYGIPNVVYSMQMGGASAPATLAAILAVANAEVLSHLVIIQLKRPGAPIVYGAMPNVMDMKTTIYPYGAPELSLLVGGLTELSHYYNLPMFGTAGCTDAKIVGAQAALEITYQCIFSALSGANMVHDVGLIDHATGISAELVVLMDEVIDMVGVAMGGIEVTDETLALELIDQVGPGGHYLTQDHTLEHFRRFWVPTILDRSMLSTIPEGDKPAHCEERLRAKTLKIIAEHQPERLPDDVLHEVHKVEKSWFKSLGLEEKYAELLSV